MKFYTTFLLLLSGVSIRAEEKVDTVRQVEKRGFVTRLLDYFNDANKEKKNKRFDFSVIGGPHYSTDTKLGLGLVAAGLYRSDPNDTLQPPSMAAAPSAAADRPVHLRKVRREILFDMGNASFSDQKSAGRFRCSDLCFVYNIFSARTQGKPGRIYTCFTGRLTAPDSAP